MNNDVIGSNRTNTSRPVAVWIGIGIFMLIVQVILGGVTRLTGSGLSITEWDVITGAVPPMNEQSWVREFDKYRQTPQYQLLNIDFTLRDFKFIFFWEWIHRLWARLIGVVFIIGFVYLSWKRLLAPKMKRPLIILFLLGALQGAVGWIMVKSGLEGDAVYVAPVRLAMHFIFAFVLIAYAYWFYLELVVEKRQRMVSPKLNSFIGWVGVLIIVQLVFGALMAGHKAATAAPTWPDINGDFFPGSTFRDTPFLLNFIENKITIHFVHRNLAYLIFLLVVILSLNLLKIKSSSPALRRLRTWPAILVTAQALLGIFSLLTSPRIVPNHWGAFEWFAQLHQVVGMLLALSFVGLYFLVRRS